LWPSKYEEPTDLLGWLLEKLDPIRLEYRVHIEETTNAIRCLKISCQPLHNDAEDCVYKAVIGIRAAVRDAKTKAVAAKPIYIVVPPNAGAMRSIVRAAKTDTILVDQSPLTLSRPPKILYKSSGIHLAGNILSEEELLDWQKSKHNTVFRSNLRRFEDYLAKTLMFLALDKGLMRMRVHFGTVIITKSRTPFREDKMGFDDFAKMMSNENMSSEFDREFAKPISTYY
jgi:hypothetical protein